MPTLPDSALQAGDRIEITFGAIGAFLALLAVIFAGATWSLQRRAMQRRNRK